MLFTASRDALSESIPLPFRYLSDDGLCAIDVRLRQGLAEGTTNGLAISEQAGAILVECVHVQKEGGTSYLAGRPFGWFPSSKVHLSKEHNIEIGHTQIRW